MESDTLEYVMLGNTILYG